VSVAVTGVVAWHEQLGPLHADPSLAGATRFARIVAHVLSGLGVSPEDPTPWVVATARGPWAARVQHARAPLHAIPSAATAVRELERVFGRHPSTIVAAGVRTAAMGLVHARAQAGPVVLVVADEGAAAYDAIAVGMRLRGPGAAIAALGAITRRSDAADASIAAAVAGNPVAAALGLATRIEAGTTGWVGLEPSVAVPGSRWAVELIAR
jgi:hypothetical protein